MYRLFLCLLTAALIATPARAKVSEPDAYADDIYNTSPANLFRPTGAVGAPDGSYAEFYDRDVYITLDMGDGEEGTGDLTLHLLLFNFGATYRVEFWDANRALIERISSVIPLQTSQVVVPYTSNQSYRYVHIVSVEEEVWKLDAIEAASFVGQDPLELGPQLPEDPAPDADAPIYNRGDLIKLPDDGDPSTQYDSAVYTIGSNGKRHAFPNQDVFFSWYDGFGNVREVDADTMASFALGKNVTMRPGTYLLKLQTDPKVYAVAEGATLRPIANELTAKEIYGANWSDRVVDMPDVFFANYTMGNAQGAEIQPDGTVGTYKGLLYYVRTAKRFLVTEERRLELRLRPSFYTEISRNMFELYADGDELPLDAYLQYPY